MFGDVVRLFYIVVCLCFFLSFYNQQIKSVFSWFYGVVFKWLIEDPRQEIPQSGTQLFVFLVLSYVALEQLRCNKVQL